MTDHTSLSSDPLTVGAIAVLVYLVATFLHEAVGHGGACALLGGRVLTVSSVHCQCDYREISRNRIRAVEAAGTVVNLVFGLLCAAALVLGPPDAAAWRYFLWLSAVVNTLLGGGYLMVSPFLNFGDWAEFVEGLRGQLAWKFALTAAGLLISFAALYFGRERIEYFCGYENPMRSRQAWLLTALPYAVGGIVSCAVAFLNPVSKLLVATSAGASTLGGTSWLLWIGHLTATLPPRAASKPAVVALSPALIALAGAALIVWAVLLAPGFNPPRR